MSIIHDEKKLTPDEIATLLNSDIPVDRIEAMGYLLDKDYSLDAFVDLIAPLKNSNIPAMFNMTEGDIASLVLAVRDIEPYKGDNDIVANQIELLSE